MKAKHFKDDLIVAQYYNFIKAQWLKKRHYYSFIKATQMWALATKSTPWIQFLQKYKFPQLESYFAAIPLALLDHGLRL